MSRRDKRKQNIELLRAIKTGKKIIKPWDGKFITWFENDKGELEYKDKESDKTYVVNMDELGIMQVKMGGDQKVWNEQRMTYEESHTNFEQVSLEKFEEQMGGKHLTIIRAPNCKPIGYNPEDDLPKDDKPGFIERVKTAVHDFIHPEPVIETELTDDQKKARWFNKFGQRDEEKVKQVKKPKDERSIQEKAEALYTAMMGTVDVLPGHERKMMMGTALGEESKEGRHYRSDISEYMKIYMQ